MHVRLKKPQNSALQARYASLETGLNKLKTRKSSFVWKDKKIAVNVFNSIFLIRFIQSPVCLTHNSVTKNIHTRGPKLWPKYN